MADITMCEGGSCFHKNNCYRYTAIPNEWRQSYFAIIPLRSELSVNGDPVQQCDQFITLLWR